MQRFNITMSNKIHTRARHATKNALKMSALYKEIQKECGYHLYEIEDVINAFSRVSMKTILNKRPVRLMHFCTIVPWTNPSKKTINPNTKEMMQCKESYTIKVVPALHFKGLLNPGEEVQEEEDE